MTELDPAQKRLRDAARYVRTLAFGRYVRPTSDLLKLADWLEAGINAPANPCRDCGKPLPPRTGRGAPRKVCEECRPARPNQYRANIPDPEKVEA